MGVVAVRTPAFPDGSVNAHFLQNIGVAGGTFHTERRVGQKIGAV